MTPWRFLDTGISSASENMAIDEALLDYFLEEDSTPVLRFYQWKVPTLSIGRNQSLIDINLDWCRESGIQVIRRATGGRAVFHQGELTYSFVSGKRFGMPEQLFESYLLLSKTISRGLEKLKKEVFFALGDAPPKDYLRQANCFASSTVTDLNYQGRKLVGSAQLRRGNCLLQHGSILLDQDFSRLAKIFFIDPGNSQINLKNILGLVPPIGEIKEKITEAFSEQFLVKFDKSELNQREKFLADSYLQRYKTL